MTATATPPRSKRRTSIVHDLLAARRAGEAMERMIAGTAYARPGRKPGGAIRCPKAALHAHGDEHPSCLVKTQKGGLRCQSCGLDVGILDAGVLLGFGGTPAEVAKRLDEQFRGKGGAVEEGRESRPAPREVPPAEWQRDHASRQDSLRRAGEAEAARMCAACRLDHLGAMTLGAGMGDRRGRATIGFLVENERLEPCGLWERDGRPGKEGRGKSVAGGHAGVIGLAAAIRRYDERVAAGLDAVLAVCEGESDLTALVGAIMSEGDVSPFCPFGVTGVGVAEKFARYAEAVGHRRVAILLDDDEEGRRAAERAAEQLAGTAAEVRIVALPLTDEERARVDEDGRRVAKDVRYLLSPDVDKHPGDLLAAFEAAPVFETSPVEAPNVAAVGATSTAAALAAGGDEEDDGEDPFEPPPSEETAGRPVPPVGATVTSITVPARGSIRIPSPRRGVDLVKGPLTDVGAAERLVRLYEGLLLYVIGVGWHVFTGRRFERVELDVLIRMATVLARRLYETASMIKKKGRREKLVAFALGLESEGRLRAAVNLARSVPGVMVKTDAIDADPDLLNVLDGTLHLPTSTLRPHDPADLITKIAPVEWLPGEPAPTFERFLADVTCGDAELADFLQLVAGYSATGHTREHAVFITNGAGNNGKSTLGELLRDALGDYARNADFATFTGTRADAGPRPDIARLLGARFVTALEGAEGQRLDEQLVKQLTGGDTITARHLYQDAIEFRPSFKLWFATNHRPKVRGTDTGIWRRLRLIPFNAHFPKEKQDKKLPEKLRAELPGVLQWIANGAARWYEEGLGEAQTVTEATAAYREEQDQLAQFIRDRCRTGEGEEVPAKALYEAFRGWCEENGEKPLSGRVYGAKLEERGFVQHRTKSARIWQGIALAEAQAGDR